MEIGQPTWMVRQQLWSPSIICQWCRWVASIFTRWNLNRYISSTAIASDPPESGMSSYCEGSSTTSVIHTRGSRFPWCPVSSARYCSMKKVYTIHRIYIFHRVANICVCHTTVPCRRDTTENSSHPHVSNTPACNLLLGDSHPLSLGGRHGDNC